MKVAGAATPPTQLNEDEAKQHLQDCHDNCMVALAVAIAVGTDNAIDLITFQVRLWKKGKTSSGRVC
eukprot:CAMPEP_0206462104 /NCGR_PEP_ID=MMETSP0324_2-20121206/25779_1 /ASSEMBLY_ACC=CAM_ASM_000836 /TAXON_ID=2866 /ORGANISM="Crypthecodinium cohnii, Strain Seligo" /LENGTH=66 /DNA_ID=CAMNT_0053934195 /DNA_START=52 /DNA_END=253 /DNA_ORIENTATION=-